MIWVLGFIVLAVIGVLVYAAIQRPESKRAAQVRKRYALEAADGARIPLAASPGPQPPTSKIEEINATPIFPDERGETVPEPRGPGSNWLVDLAREDAPIPLSEPSGPITGRLVQTPDGEAIITTPPFALRPQMLSNRLGRYVNGLSKRLPAWVMACPRVRLESLVSPTPPDGRDADDWSQWRRRVRLRAVDVVLCDRRNWQPLLAISLKPVGRSRRVSADGGVSSNGSVAVLTLGGGYDRMIEEVLGHVGLPLIHGSGRLAEDWPLIAPYVEQAILKTPSEEEMFLATDDTQGRPDPDAAVRLLRMDADKGWLLE